MANEVPTPTAVIVPPSAGPVNNPDGSVDMLIHGGAGNGLNVRGGDTIIDLTQSVGNGSGRNGAFVVKGLGTVDTGESGEFFLGADGGVKASGAPILFGTSGTIGSGNMHAGTVTTGTIAIAGALVGDVVEVTPHTYPGDGIVWGGYVSTNGTVTVVLNSVAATAAVTGSVYFGRVHGAT